MDRKRKKSVKVAINNDGFVGRPKRRDAKARKESEYPSITKAGES